MADDKMTPEPLTVVAQEAKTVGDDALTPREPSFDVNKEQVAAQVVQPREGDVDKVNVHEVSVQMDEIITDPSSPLAVQVPDAGRGDMSLPIHRLAGKTVEQQFAASAQTADEKPARRAGR